MKKNKVTKLFILIIALSFFSFTHPFHLSVTDLKYNAATKTLQMSCRLFADDLENILSQQTKGKVDIFKEVNEVVAKKYYAQYINSHIVVNNNGKYVAFNLLGAEIEDNAVWFYLESTEVPFPKELYIKNNSLCDLFQDQTNIINVNVNGQKKVQRLVCEKTDVKFSF